MRLKLDRVGLGMPEGCISPGQSGGHAANPLLCWGISRLMLPIAEIIQIMMEFVTGAAVPQLVSGLSALPTFSR